MSAGKFFTTIAAIGMLGFAATASAGDAGEFSASSYTCLQYTNGLGENSSTRMQSEIARIWIMGFITGHHKAQSKLEFTDDASEGAKITNLFLQRCREHAQNSIVVVALQGVVTADLKLPKQVTAGFSPSAYTCGDHVDAKAGASDAVAKADVAELWAFAFIQGIKSFANPDLEIPITAKPQLMGAVSRSCANNRATPFMDLAALVAEKVKLNQ